MWKGDSRQEGGDVRKLVERHPNKPHNPFLSAPRPLPPVSNFDHPEIAHTHTRQTHAAGREPVGSCAAIKRLNTNQCATHRTEKPLCRVNTRPRTSDSQAYSEPQLFLFPLVDEDVKRESWRLCKFVGVCTVLVASETKKRPVVVVVVGSALSTKLLCRREECNLPLPQKEPVVDRFERQDTNKRGMSRACQRYSVNVARSAVVRRALQRYRYIYSSNIQELISAAAC